jgi:uncharacterized protein GlcG (DUF336 family)
MTTGTEQEIAQKAEEFLLKLEAGARAYTNNRAQNRQTGHLIVVSVVRDRGQLAYLYRVDGMLAWRNEVLAILMGKGDASVVKH